MSTGNDIVAWCATDSDRTSRHRFYSRIISPIEQQSFHQLPANAGLSFSAFVWLLWSIKESAYKYASRTEPSLVFSPLPVPVTGLTRGLRAGNFTSMVSFRDTILYAKSRIRPVYVSTVVSDDPGFAHTRHGIRRIASADSASQSAQVRKLALRSLAAEYPDAAALRIVRTPDGPPTVWSGDRQLDLPISLAHHDRWVAFSYRLPADRH